MQLKRQLSSIFNRKITIFNRQKSSTEKQTTNKNGVNNGTQCKWIQIRHGQWRCTVHKNNTLAHDYHQLLQSSIISSSQAPTSKT